MTIWEILIIWLMSDVLAWGLWTKFYVYGAVAKEIGKLDFAKQMELAELDWGFTNCVVLEWILFIVWPVGIIQRTIAAEKIRKTNRK